MQKEPQPPIEQQNPPPIQLTPQNFPMVAGQLKQQFANTQGQTQQMTSDALNIVFANFEKVINALFEDVDAKTKQVMEKNKEIESLRKELMVNKAAKKNVEPEKEDNPQNIPSTQ